MINFKGSYLIIIVGLTFFSCRKEKRIMEKQAGVWEIKSWRGVVYEEGEIISDTTILDLGYIALTNNGLNGQNEAHYNLNYSPPCWGTIANSSTLLDLKDDNCWWQVDSYSPYRFALIGRGSYGELIYVMFSITKTKKNRQTWNFVTNANSDINSMKTNDIFVMEKVN